MELESERAQLLTALTSYDLFDCIGCEGCERVESMNDQGAISLGRTNVNEKDQKLTNPGYRWRTAQAYNFYSFCVVSFQVSVYDRMRWIVVGRRWI